MMSALEAEEEYPEDLILLNYEQSSIYHANKDAEGFKNLNSSWQFSEDIIFNPALQRLCSSPEIPNRSAPRIDRSVSVKLIDCGKFPWYFKRYTQQIINKINCCQPISIADSDTDDDCIILGEPIEKVLNKTKANTNCPIINVEEDSPSELENELRILKRMESMKRREDIEIQKALNQKNRSIIDFKRNKGLVGLTVVRKVIVDDVPPDATIDKAKEDSKKTEKINTATHVSSTDNILSSCDTDRLAVVDLEKPAVAQHKKPNEIVKNVVSGSETRPAGEMSHSSSNKSVKGDEDNNKKSHKDSLKNKIDNVAENAEKHDDKLKKVQKSESLIRKYSSSKLNNKKSENNVKDRKKTNKYIHDQLKKRKMDSTYQPVDAQQKFVTVDQPKSYKNVPKPVPEDDASSKKDIKKLTCTSEKIAKGIVSGSSSPILQCNSMFKKHKTVHEVTSKRTDPDITQNKTASNKTSIKETSNIQSQYTKQNVLKTSQSEDKRTKQSEISVANPHNDLDLNKTGQTKSIASPGQTKGSDKLHYYSLSYTATKNTSSDAQKTGDGQINNNNTYQTNSTPHNLPGPSQAINNSLEESPIHILSVETINNSDTIFKNNQIPTVSDLHRLQPLPPTSCLSDGLSQLPIDPSQNRTNLKQAHLIPISIPTKNLKLPKHYIINNVQDPNYRPAILRPRYPHNPRFGPPMQPMQTHFSSRPMFPHFRGPPPHKGPTPQQYARPPFMYRNSLPPQGLHNNSSLYCRITSQRLAEPVMPSVTIQSCQDIHPRPINSNQYLRNYDPGFILRAGNPCNMPWAYGNNYYPRIKRPQQPPPPSAYHCLPQHTIIQSKPPQNERCLHICNNNNLKENNTLTAPVTLNVDNGAQATKESMSSCPVNNFNVPVSIVLETLEPVETRIKMLEELDKVTIDEDFEIQLKREHESVANSQVEETVLNTKARESSQSMKMSVDQQAAINNTNGIQQAATIKNNGYQEFTTYKKPEFPQATTNKELEIQQARTNKSPEIQQAKATTNKKPEMQQATNNKNPEIQQTKPTINKKPETQQATKSKISEIKQATTNKPSGIQQAITNKKSEIKKATTNKTSAIQQALTIKNNGNKEATTYKKPEIRQATTNKISEIKQATINKIHEIHQAATNKTSEIQQTSTIKNNGYKRATTYKKPEIRQATTNKISEIKQATINKIYEIHQAATNKTSEIQQTLTIKNNDNKKATTYKKPNILQAIINKKLKIQKATKKKIIKNILAMNNNCDSTLPLKKGYSPPILPIPGTIEEILEKVISEPNNNMARDSRPINPDIQLQKVKSEPTSTVRKPKSINANVQPKPIIDKAKKISLDEYKKRIYKHDDADYSPMKKMRKESHHSLDPDLGYDSDSTIIISDR